jgi:hypothetical protein
VPYSRSVVAGRRVLTGQTVANLVVARIGSDGRINLYTHTSTHVVVDVVAWFSD